MRRLSFLLWAAMGLSAALLGWTVGGYAGSQVVRVVLASCVVGSAVGSLWQRPRITALSGAAAGTGALLGYYGGTFLVGPLLAWPLAGLGIGVATAGIAARTRTRVEAIVIAPLFAGLGFVCGAAVFAFIGLQLDRSDILADFAAGGASGFGALVVMGFGLMRNRISFTPASVGD